MASIASGYMASCSSKVGWFCVRDVKVFIHYGRNVCVMCQCHDWHSHPYTYSLAVPYWHFPSSSLPSAPIANHVLWEYPCWCTLSPSAAGVPTGTVLDCKRCKGKCLGDDKWWGVFNYTYNLEQI